VCLPLSIQANLKKSSGWDIHPYCGILAPGALVNLSNYLL